MYAPSNSDYRCMRIAARERAKRWAHDDWQALAEDLEQEGWLAFFAHGELPIWKCWCNARSAMLFYFFQWKYGLCYRKDNSHFRALNEGHELQEWTGKDDRSPEQIVSDREVLTQIHRRLSQKRRKGGSTNGLKALAAFALEGSDVISPDVRKQVGFVSTACVYEGKQHLRLQAKQVLNLLLLVCILTSCSSGQGQSWSRYINACSMRIENNQQPFCEKFPLPPGGKDRAELAGAIIGAAQDIGEAVGPLVIPALAGKVASE